MTVVDWSGGRMLATGRAQMGGPTSWAVLRRLLRFEEGLTLSRVQEWRSILISQFERFWDLGEGSVELGLWQESPEAVVLRLKRPEEEEVWEPLRVRKGGLFSGTSRPRHRPLGQVRTGRGEAGDARERRNLGSRVPMEASRPRTEDHFDPEEVRKAIEVVRAEAASPRFLPPRVGGGPLRRSFGPQVSALLVEKRLKGFAPSLAFGTSRPPFLHQAALFFESPERQYLRLIPGKVLSDKVEGQRGLVSQRAEVAQRHALQPLGIASSPGEARHPSRRYGRTFISQAFLRAGSPSEASGVRGLHGQWAGGVSERAIPPSRFDLPAGMQAEKVASPVIFERSQDATLLLPISQVLGPFGQVSPRGEGLERFGLLPKVEGVATLLGRGPRRAPLVGLTLSSPRTSAPRVVERVVGAYPIVEADVFVGPGREGPGTQVEGADVGAGSLVSPRELRPLGRERALGREAGVEGVQELGLGAPTSVSVPISGGRRAPLPSQSGEAPQWFVDLPNVLARRPFAGVGGDLEKAPISGLREAIFPEAPEGVFLALGGRREEVERGALFAPGRRAEVARRERHVVEGVEGRDGVMGRGPLFRGPRRSGPRPLPLRQLDKVSLGREGTSPIRSALKAKVASMEAAVRSLQAGEGFRLVSLGLKGPEGLLFREREVSSGRYIEPVTLHLLSFPRPQEGPPTEGQVRKGEVGEAWARFTARGPEAMLFSFGPQSKGQGTGLLEETWVTSYPSTLGLEAPEGVLLLSRPRAFGEEARVEQGLTRRVTGVRPEVPRPFTGRREIGFREVRGRSEREAFGVRRGERFSVLERGEGLSPASVVGPKLSQGIGEAFLGEAFRAIAHVLPLEAPEGALLLSRPRAFGEEARVEQGPTRRVTSVRSDVPRPFAGRRETGLREVRGRSEREAFGVRRGERFSVLERGEGLSSASVVGPKLSQGIGEAFLGEGYRAIAHVLPLEAPEGILLLSRPRPSRERMAEIEGAGAEQVGTFGDLGRATGSLGREVFGVARGQRPWTFEIPVEFPLPMLSKGSPTMTYGLGAKEDGGPRVLGESVMAQKGIQYGGPQRHVSFFAGVRQLSQGPSREKGPGRRDLLTFVLGSRGLEGAIHNFAFVDAPLTHIRFEDKPEVFGRDKPKFMTSGLEPQDLVMVRSDTPVRGESTIAFLRRTLGRTLRVLPEEAWKGGPLDETLREVLGIKHVERDGLPGEVVAPQGPVKPERVSAEPPGIPERPITIEMRLPEIGSGQAGARTEVASSLLKPVTEGPALDETMPLVSPIINVVASQAMLSPRREEVATKAKTPQKGAGEVSGTEPVIDLDALAMEMVERIVRRLKREKERRGYHE